MADDYTFTTDLQDLERELADRQDVEDLMRGLAALTADVGAHRMTPTEALAEIASGKVTLRGLLAGIHGTGLPAGHA